MKPPPEYAFVASEATQARASGAVLALNALGYDARRYAPGETEARRARAVVFCDVPPDIERYVYDVGDLAGAQAARGARALTAATPALARAASEALGRPVEVVPEPLEGPRLAPRAPRVKPRSRPLEWLARRAGLATDHWRTRLLWIGEEADIEAIVGAYPALKELGRALPLSLHCVGAPEVLDALLERVQEDDPDALRLSFEALSPEARARGLDECDFVVLPGSPRLEREALHAGRFAIAGDDPCEAIRGALARPRETLEALRRAQERLDETHAPAAVARAWARILMKGTR